MAHDEHELGRSSAETPAAPLPREDRRLITAMAAVTVTPAAVEILSSRTTPEILIGLPLLAAAAALYGRYGGAAAPGARRGRPLEHAAA